MCDLWWLFGGFFGWSGWLAYAYCAFFWSWDAAFDENVGASDVAVADESSFGVDFFAVFADFEDAFVVFYALVVAHLSCAWYAVHEVVWIPWSEGTYASFCFSAFVLKDGDMPAFDWSLEAFAGGDCRDVCVLPFFEDFFWCDGFAEECFGVVYFLLRCSSTDFDFVYVWFLFG